MEISVSIIVPIYNVEPYIKRALVSVYTQNYKDIEIIIVDDCGKDNSISVARSVAKQYPERKTTFVKHDYNKGLSVARNSGMAVAHGDYIFFLDGDDELPQTAISNLLMVARSNGMPDIVVGLIRNTQGTETTTVADYVDRDFSSFPTLLEGNNDIVLEMFDYSAKNNIPPTAQNKLYRSDFLKKHSLYFLPNIIHEDEKFLIDISCYINTIGFLNKVTYIRYINANSIITSLSNTRSMENWLEIIRNSYSSIEFSRPLLRISYLMKEIENKYLELPKEATNVALKAKRNLYQLSIMALRKRSFCLFLSPLFLLALPFRVSHFSYVNRRLKEYYSWKKILKYT